jgi:hypothetical protein
LITPTPRNSGVSSLPYAVFEDRVVEVGGFKDVVAVDDEDESLKRGARGLRLIACFDFFSESFVVNDDKLVADVAGLVICVGGADALLLADG